MLRIWGRTNSINVQKVQWCCHELGLDYDQTDAGLHFGVTDTPEYLAMNPNRLVPTIEDGEVRLWESNVIVRYLAHQYGAGSLCPANIATRFDAERWMDWQATAFWPVLRPLFIALIRTAATERDASVVSKSEALSLSAVRILDQRLTIAFFSPAMPSQWAIYLRRRRFIAGIRSTSTIRNCRMCVAGMT